MLLKPIITEKSLREAKDKRYTFATLTEVTKVDIKRMVENLFKVKVLKVQTMIMPGKSKRRGKKGLTVNLTDWKKAVVRINPSEKIDLFETGENK